MRCDSTLSMPSLAGMARNTVYARGVDRGLEHAVRGRADGGEVAERVDEADAVGDQAGLLVVEGLVGEREAGRPGSATATTYQMRHMPAATVTSPRRVRNRREPPRAER